MNVFRFLAESLWRPLGGPAPLQMTLEVVQAAGGRASRGVPPTMSKDTRGYQLLPHHRTNTPGGSRGSQRRPEWPNTPLQKQLTLDCF